MKYRGYDILVECNTDKAVFTTDEQGNVLEFDENIDSEAEPVYYGIRDEDGDYIDWIDYSQGMSEVKKYIDELKESEQ